MSQTELKIVLFLHLVAAVCAIATSTHLLLRLIRTWRSHGAYVAQIRIHAILAGGAYLVAMALGALLYPAFRLQVRGELFDAHMPWLTGLFEIKEHLASLGLVPAIGILVLSRVLDFRSHDDRRYLGFYGSLVAVLLGVLVYNACTGWYLGSVKSL